MYLNKLGGFTTEWRADLRDICGFDHDLEFQVLGLNISVRIGPCQFLSFAKMADEDRFDRKLSLAGKNENIYFEKTL